MAGNFSFRNVTTALIISISFFACNWGRNAEDEELEAQKKLIARGKYLVEITGCNNCHSPKAITADGPIPSPTKLLSGHPQDTRLESVDTNIVYDWILFNHHNTAVAGPWGVTFASNISADSATGIGSWTLEQFGKAMKEGKFRGKAKGRTLLPPMPWKNYTNISDRDLNAIFTYLKSTKPIYNEVPEPILPGSENWINYLKRD
jgi:mono/diheme cytochrome c family protein